ncbi:hypothetical protein Tco_0770073 [Tanacetum coccineum]|uniref:CCHC-type domain-containing protein n=1 Tax=Tanacetum coccineum TaxID=301880 RepID=A0ABQ4ZC62_9ASTR
MMMENKRCGELMIKSYWMDKLLKEVLMVDELSIVETDKVNRADGEDNMKMPRGTTQVVTSGAFNNCVSDCTGGRYEVAALDTNQLETRSLACVSPSCYLCGDPLDGILCRRCSCGWCGNKLNDGFCSYCASKAGNSFAYDPNPNSFDNSPNNSDYFPQPQFETYSCELCGNDSHYGYDCPSRVPLVYEPEPCYNQNFSDNYPQNSPSFSQQYLCCANCGGPHYDYQCQPINGTYYEPNQSYDYGFDQFQPPKFTVNHQIFNNQNEFLNSQNELLNSQNKLMEQMTTICDLVGQVMQKKEEEKRIAEEQAAKISISRKFPVYDDDDDEYSIQTQEYLKKFSYANTPDLPIKEPVNSLSIGDEHLDTIPAKESDEVIKSSVKDLDDESLSEEEIQKDEFKYFSNPLYDLDDEIITNEKILPNQNDLDIVILIPPRIDERCFNAESDLLESLLNRDSPIDSTKIDFIFDEFSLPRPLEISSSQSFSQIPMEEIDLFLDNSIPWGIDNDDD